MKSAFPVGVNLAWWRVVVGFVVTVALLWACTSLWHGPVALAVPITSSVLIVAALLITWRTATLGSLLIGRLVRRRTPASRPKPAVDHRLRWTTEEVAIRGDERDALAVVAVDGPAHSPSVLDQHQVQSGVMLPVDVIAAAVHQFDVTLAGIDIHSVGRRRAGQSHHHYAATYSAQLGDYGAVGERRTWCALRLRGSDNAGAIATRDSVAATLAACAQRLAIELTAHGCPSRLVDASELDDIDDALSTSVAGGSLAQWSGLVHPSGVTTSYWVSASDVSTATLDRLWAPDSDQTVTTIQLRPHSGGRVGVGALVRYTTARKLKEPPLRGLNLLAGQQDRALAATQLEPAVPTLRVPYRLLGDHEALRAPIGATGILIGATGKGHPMLIPLGAPRPGAQATVTVAAELAMLVQIAQRAAATGYRVAVLTDRPSRWRPVTALGLRIVSDLPAELPDGGRAMMVIYDGAGPAHHHPSAAVVVRTVDRGTASVADVHLEQDSATTAVVRTAEFRFRLHIDVKAERNLLATASQLAA